MLGALLVLALACLASAHAARSTSSFDEQLQLAKNGRTTLAAPYTAVQSVSLYCLHSSLM